MSIFKYPYTQTGNGYTFALIPIILKNIETNEQSGYIAQIDSGAVFNVFHSDIASALGIDLTKVKEKVLFKGVGKDKDFVGKPYVVNLTLAQKGKSYTFDSLIIFSDDVNKDGHPLLGMGGFFDQLKSVTFNNERKKVILEK